MSLQFIVHCLSRVTQGTGPLSESGNRGKQRCQFRQGNLKDEDRLYKASAFSFRGKVFLLPGIERKGKKMRNKKGNWLFTSESVTEGHPDKICDQISDSVLDAILEQDPTARVACETCTTTGMVLVMGEISTSAYVDIPSIGSRREVSSYR